MQYNIHQTRESGFTLVELAIVMLIIGLLVGGVLKGQEMLESARLSSTTQAMESYAAAANTFEGQYGGLAGDIDSPENRVPNCETSSSACGESGNSDGRIEQGGGAALSGTDEAAVFWSQMAAAGLVDGVRANPDPSSLTPGENVPEADLAGVFNIGYNVPGGSPSLNSIQGGGSAGQFHFFTIVVDPSSQQAGSNAPFTPLKVRQIDQKMDNGLPDSGSVYAAGASGCVDGDNYAAGNQTAECSFYSKAFR